MGRAPPEAASGATAPRPRRRALHPALPPLALHAALLCGLLAAALLPRSAAQSLPAAQDPAAQDGADAQLAARAPPGQCPVSMRYAVSLGTPQRNGGTPQVPIFVAVMTLQNNVNVSARLWGSARVPRSSRLSGGWWQRALRRSFQAACLAPHSFVGTGQESGARLRPPAPCSPLLVLTAPRCP